MIHDVMNGLMAKMATRNYDGFPSRYVAIDIETTGVELGVDLIGQVGYCVVDGGKVRCRHAVVLDWTRRPGVDVGWLARRMATAKNAVEFDRDGRTPTGRRYHLSVERMRTEGVDSGDALRDFRTLLADHHAGRVFFVAHNGYHFDCEFLADAFSRYLRMPFRFDDYEVFDTGMVEKSSQANISVWANDTPKSFSARVYNSFLKGVRWSLDRHCVPKYGLDRKHDLDMNQAHDAAYDAYLAHLLFEHYKEIAYQPTT